MCIWKILPLKNFVICVKSKYVYATFENDHLHPEPEDGKNSFFQSCSVRLTWHTLGVSPWLTHKSAPFCHAQVHDITVFDELHFGRYWFYQWYTPSALIENAIFEFSLMRACPVGKHFYLAHTHIRLICSVIVNQLKQSVPSQSSFLPNTVPWCSRAFSSELRSFERVTLWSTWLHSQYQDFNPVVSYSIVLPNPSIDQ